MITHGHSDHARPGHGAVLATAQTLAVMAERYGPGFAGRTQSAAYGETTLIGGVAVRFAPAWRILVGVVLAAAAAWAVARGFRF